jgi:hypothetical protein
MRRCEKDRQLLHVTEERPSDGDEGLQYPRRSVPTIECIVARCETNEAIAKADPFKQAGAPA